MTGNNIQSFGQNNSTWDDHYGSGGGEADRNTFSGNAPDNNFNSTGYVPYVPVTARNFGDDSGGGFYGNHFGGGDNVGGGFRSSNFGFNGGSYDSGLNRSGQGSDLSYGTDGGNRPSDHFADPIETPTPSEPIARFTPTEQQRGLAFADTLVGLEENPLGPSDAVLIRSDPELAGQLGQIVGDNPAADSDEFRAGMVFASGVRPGGTLGSADTEAGAAGSSADTHLTEDLIAGNIGTSDFVALANDGVFLTRNDGVDNVFRERYTDQGVENIENGREATNGEDRTYTSRDGLLFKVPDISTDGAPKPYFVTEAGEPIPQPLQDLADAEGQNGGMSDLTIRAIGILGGTAENVTPEEQALAAQYLDPESGMSKEEFLTGIDEPTIEPGEDVIPQVGSVTIPEDWKTDVLDPMASELRAEFVGEDGRVTDEAGLLAAIDKKGLMPAGEQYVYERVTGQPMPSTESSIPLAPVLDNRGNVLIEPERHQELNDIAVDISARVTHLDDFDMTTAEQKVGEAVNAGTLTQDEADFVSHQVAELQKAGPDQDISDRPGAWQQGTTPFISNEQKAGYAADIEQLESYRELGSEAVSEAIARYMPDASPQEVDYLHAEVMGRPSDENPVHSAPQYASPHDTRMYFGISQEEHYEAETIIQEIEFRMDAQGLSSVEMHTALQQSLENGDITPGQFDFIMNHVFRPEPVFTQSTSQSDNSGNAGRDYW